MKPLGDPTGYSHGVRLRRWSAALVVLVAAVSLGTQPALPGDPVKAGPPSVTAGRVRPLDLVKASVSQVLAAVQSRPGGSRESGQRRAEIRRVADGLFDFREMARLSLSRH
jgi:hypothetical protein